ncbi:hypothetical protein LGH70_17050 [Hymenobacter sp. BT635]|uniref:Uncharacterized protein n=1 Tax=Hymenobacter nitidus TaxID=2880929 RepID=A0ABS8AFU3_9BACT|nr:hypothetical protein [Hymenobacter nitidus]MCB2379308.1 hypothetical protein [Hymenobacter nitidus]
MLQKPIAAEISASAPGRRRWVDIHYELNRQPSTGPQPPQHLYCIIDREFDTALLELYAPDGDEDLALICENDYHVADEPQLYAVLTELGIDPGSFDAPWNVAHPVL